MATKKIGFARLTKAQRSEIGRKAGKASARARARARKEAAAKKAAKKRK